LFVSRTRLSAVLAQDHLVPPPLTSAEFFDPQTSSAPKKSQQQGRLQNFAPLLATAIVGMATLNYEVDE